MRKLTGPMIRIEGQPSPKFGPTPRGFACILIGVTASAWLVFGICQFMPSMTYASFSFLLALAFTALTIAIFVGVSIAYLLWRLSFRFIAERWSDF